MSKRCALFMEVFLAEMEDLLEDLKNVENQLQQRFKEIDISDYVFKANEALFIRETDAVRQLFEKIKSIQIDCFNSPEALADFIDEYIKDYLNKLDEPKAVYGFLKRKLDKVLKYIDLD